ncbi:hypothetical protein OROGR_000887 [Orobanche gracilis]
MATISRRSPLGDVVLFLTTSPFHFPSPSHFDSDSYRSRTTAAPSSPSSSELLVAPPHYSRSGSHS